MSLPPSDQAPPERHCDWHATPQPCSIVIFGASGDLTARKLIPALYGLYLAQGLPERFAVLGVARSPLSDEALAEKGRQGAAAAGMDLALWPRFASHLHYQSLHYDDPQGYQALTSRLAELDRRHQLGRCRIFNLAIPPALYEEVARGLAGSGLAAEGPDGGWTRLVVEKPFGRDLTSARSLNRALAEGFGEHQVFRIDHYMAKETVQNILMLRFTNAIFEPLWNRNFIDHVRINASESLGVGHRAGYYEQAGVLRDMVQNHLMQLLALVAAEPPARFDAERVRDKQLELFHSLHPIDLEQLPQHLVLGQYGAGQAEGAPARAYREEEGVDPDSNIPTYAMLKLFVDNWRWKGVPFYLSSGKRLKRKVTRIDIQFKEVPHSMLRDTYGLNVRANRLVLGIHPEEEIFLGIQAKRPGARLCLRTAGLRFAYSGGDEGLSLDAYAKALVDTMAGDQTLFWRQDCLESAWQFYDPLLSAMESCAYQMCQLHPYPAGSYGPQAAMDMLPEGSWPEKPG